MSTQENPLASYFRTPKLYIALPSKGQFYTDDVITLNNDNEVGILPLTAKDEILFHTPDALLNGEALKQVMKSCVVGLKNPSKMISNDIDAILMAIKHASYGDELSLTVTCPECEHENTYSLSVNNSLSKMTHLKDKYFVTLESGLTVFLKPYTLDSNIKAMRKTFEQEKIVKNIDSVTLSEEEKLNLLSKSLQSMTELNFELIEECVSCVVHEQNNINITDKAYIKEFLENISKTDHETIKDEITKINKVGIKRKYSVMCENEKCKHEWEQELDINPTDFFTES